MKIPRSVCTDVRENVQMSGLTTFRVGGPCDLLCAPAGIWQMADTLRLLSGAGYIVLGRCSNVLVADAGIRRPVIHTARLNHIEIEGSTIVAGAGAGLPEVARAAAERGLAGMEWACGVPGSVGGAVVMNAGAYGGEMSQTLAAARVFDGERVITVREFDFGYRHSIFHKYTDWVVIEATIKLLHGSKPDIEAQMTKLKRSRAKMQPVNLPSAGSFFKRPPGHYAGGLIEQCGLKGASVGGAQVSERHAGFLVNTGGATCDDVLRLAALVRETVYKQAGVTLEPEVRLLGDIRWPF